MRFDSLHSYIDFLIYFELSQGLDLLIISPSNRMCGNMMDTKLKNNREMRCAPAESAGAI